MKDFKTLMIGFLLATCMFLLMGQGSSKSDIGRYQGFGTNNAYLVDTTTGETWMTRNLLQKEWKPQLRKLKK
tara:strand:- start:230 stop:445 length:216 start_codon:yes stop_codon:yes gene_type:complete